MSGCISGSRGGAAGVSYGCGQGTGRTASLQNAEAGQEIPDHKGMYRSGCVPFVRRRDCGGEEYQGQHHQGK